jgi:hypothetical protein
MAAKNGTDVCERGVPTRVAKWFIFSNQKSQFVKDLEGLRLENVDLFYGHFGIFYGHLGYFNTFGIY